jgi:hypothetical protein
VKKKEIKIDKKTIRILAAHAEIDPRTVERALREGVESVRSHANRERLIAAAKEMGIKLEEK